MISVCAQVRNGSAPVGAMLPIGTPALPVGSGRSQRRWPIFRMGWSSAVG